MRAYLIFAAFVVVFALSWAFLRDANAKVPNRVSFDWWPETCYELSSASQAAGTWSCFDNATLSVSPGMPLSEAIALCQQYPSHQLVQFGGFVGLQTCSVSPPPPRTDITVGWTNPTANVTRFKIWWSDAAGNAAGTALDTRSMIEPGQAYQVTIDDPLEPYLYAKYYINDVKGPASQVAGWTDTNRDLVMSWDITPPPLPTGTANLTWTPPTENADGTPLEDLAGYTIYYGDCAGAYTDAYAIHDPTATGAQVTALADGTWCFVVVARDDSGNESGYSNEVSKTLPGSTTTTGG